MDAKRFGFGLAAGLLLGIAIVASSGGFGANPLSSTLLARMSDGGTAGSSTSTTTSTTTTLTAITTTIILVPSSNTSDSTFGSVSGNGGQTTTTATSAQTQVPGTPASPPSASGYSSKIDSIARQPALSNALILVPLMVAFLLGAAIYRASVRRQEEPGPTGN